MTTAEILKAIEKNKIVHMKVSYNPRNTESVLEITDANLNLIEEVRGREVRDKFLNDTAALQLTMVEKATEYSNKGFYANINPFTN